jgi:hypothetical protein
MARRTKLGRMNLCRRICDLSGVQVRSDQGYFSRHELLELCDYLKRVQETCEALHGLHNETVKQTIVEGRIYHEPALRNKRI